MPSFLWTLLGNAWSSPVVLVMGVLHIWLLIDAVRREEWMWAAFMFFFPGFTDLI
jgi:hypothetical protein